MRETKEDAAEEAYPQARVQFDFVATSEFELDVTGKYASTGFRYCVS